MRKRVISIIIFCCIIVFAIIAIGYNRYWNNSGTTKNKTIGSFEYEYKVQREGTWITKITPKSDKDISVLKIPSRLGGRSVVKLGAEGDRFRIDDPSQERHGNLFGEDYSEESTWDNTIIAPEDVYDLVGKIKTKLEDTSLTEIKWKKVSISARNRKYKVTNGCLCSKNGKTLYGIIEDHKTITIPASVTSIPYFYTEVTDDLIYVFEGRIPPKVEDWTVLVYRKVYIPKGCEEIYRKEWEKALRDIDEFGVFCVFEEMDHF